MKQREIKFRMPIKNRDGSFKEWFYWGWVGDNGEFVSPHSKYRQCESYEYTGMKEGKGRDIYEGDIMRLHNSNRRVEFHNGAFCVTNKPHGYLEEPLFEEGEVIGNIYEHPELEEQLKSINP